MNELRSILETKIIESQRNHFLISSNPLSVLKGKTRLNDFLKKTLSKYLVSHDEHKNVMLSLINSIMPIYNDLNRAYNLLVDDDSKNLFVELLLLRCLGPDKISIERYYSDKRDKNKGKISSLIKENEFLEFTFNNTNWRLELFDLKNLGIPLKLFFTEDGVIVDFILEQYNYRNIIVPKEGDVVIDAGACWGDTALYFGNLVKSTGAVYSFEFVRRNIDLLNKNLALNKDVADIIHLIKQPLWDVSGIDLYYEDQGPASIVSFSKFDGFSGSVKTVSIDDFCSQSRIEKVDFIKMDIEGAELKALEGARETISKYRPNLAITNYHSMGDFVGIPLWINDLDLGYKIHLDHFTNYLGETVVFASSK